MPITTLGISLCSGTTRLYLPKFDVQTIWSVLGKYKLTYLFLTPMHLIELCKFGRPKSIDTSSVHGVMIGGDVIMNDLMELFQNAFPGSHCVNSYGMSEVVGSLAIFKLSNPDEFKQYKLKPTSCGTGVPGLAYKVVDLDTGKLLGPNKPGHLCIKTDTAFSGYYNQDSSDTWDNEGWLKTGDLLYYDDDRCFYVVDRIKEILKYKTHSVYPAIIENILHGHPKIEKALVVPTAHDVYGDLPTAVVLLKKDVDISPEEIEKYVRDRVEDSHRLRGGVKIVDYIPCTASGKIKRCDVKKLVREGQI